MVIQEKLAVKDVLEKLENKANQELLDLLVELVSQDHQVEKDCHVKKSRYFSQH